MRYTRRSAKAGIIALVSLLLPWEISFYPNSIGNGHVIVFLSWIYMPGWPSVFYISRYHAPFIYPTSILTLDWTEFSSYSGFHISALGLLLQALFFVIIPLALIIAGGIALIVTKKHTRMAATTVLAGFVLWSLSFFYYFNLYFGPFGNGLSGEIIAPSFMVAVYFLIPISLAFILAGVIITGVKGYTTSVLILIVTGFSLEIPVYVISGLYGGVSVAGRYDLLAFTLGVTAPASLLLNAIASVTGLSSKMPSEKVLPDVILPSSGPRI